MKIFILEDDPNRIAYFRMNLIGHDLTICTDVYAAKKEWQPPYDIVSLDHDLGGQVYVDSAMENTGMGFVRWLTALDVESPVGRYYVHSYNPVGADKMHQELRKFHKHVARVPFGPSLLEEMLA
jgi:hypothetical protein